MSRRQYEIVHLTAWLYAQRISEWDPKLEAPLG